MTDRREAALDLVLEITTLLADDMQRAFARDGLTPARAHLLWVLHTAGPSRQRDLAEALGVVPRTVTGLVDGLVRAGLVTRETDPEDRRATRVTLSRRGSDLASTMAAGKAELAEALFGPVPRGELDALLGSLAGVRDRLAGLVAADLAENPEVLR